MDKQINSEYLLIVRKHLDEIRMEMGNKPQFSLIISAHDSSVEIDEISGFACLAGITGSGLAQLCVGLCVGKIAPNPC